MRPTRVQPKRSDFVTFDDYFDAMIQYHLESAQQNLEDKQAHARPGDDTRLPWMKSGEYTAPGRYYSAGGQYTQGKHMWLQQLQQFVQEHRQ